MWKVYMHTSPSGKVYIGITSQSVNRRWRNGDGYLIKQEGKYNQPLFARAINKYGWNNIKHKVLWDNLDEETAKAIEITLIAYYKNLGISYNLTDGGDGTAGLHYQQSEEWIKKRTQKRCKTVYQCDITTLDVIKEWKSASEIESTLGYDQGLICRCCNGKRKQAYGYQWKYK